MPPCQPATVLCQEPSATDPIPTPKLLFSAELQQIAFPTPPQNFPGWGDRSQLTSPALCFLQEDTEGAAEPRQA